MVLFLLNLIKGSIQDELDGFFKTLNQAAEMKDSVSKAAFTKARRYLRASAFVELRDDLNQSVYTSMNLQTWQGHRIFAVDGSKVNLPRTEDILDYFGGQKNQNGVYPQALISQCYDVLNSFTLDLRVAPCRSSERELAELHLEKTNEGDVFLYDRGYPAFWFYALHQHRKRYFAMRIKTQSNYTYVNEFMSEEDQDKVFTLTIPREARKTCQSKCIPFDDLTLRMIKVALPNGGIEVLVTNLIDQKAYPSSKFTGLYAKRWTVEEDFKTQKSKLSIECFSGKTVTAIHQDLQAKVLTKNLTVLLTLAADKIVKKRYAQRKYEYKVNFTQALSKMKDEVVRILVSSRPESIIKKLICWFSVRVEPIRRDRSYTRKPKMTMNGRKGGTYKQVR